MDTRIQIDIDAVLEIIQNEDQNNQWFNQITDDLVELFTELKMNVSGDKVNQYMTRIIDDLVAVKESLYVANEDLSSFLTQQLNNYLSTYEGALQMLNNALNFIMEFASLNLMY